MSVIEPAKAAKPVKPTKRQKFSKFRRGLINIVKGRKIKGKNTNPLLGNYNGGGKKSKKNRNNRKTNRKNHKNKKLTRKVSIKKRK